MKDIIDKLEGPARAMGVPVSELASIVEQGEAIAVGARLHDAPVSAVWVGPQELEVRGPHVRVAEDDEQLLYDAVITELAERR